MPETVLTPLASQIANIDAGMEIFRDWLPDHGFKLIMPPPMAGSIAFASAWRRGEAHTVSHKGTSAALALLRAAQFELVKLRGASAGAVCGQCHGLGWFVTNAGTTELCRHAERAKIIAR